jgi:tRNA nucleotidyltransferase/poly(A) polymerase
VPLTPAVPRRPPIWPPSLEAVRAVVPADQEVYVVGGAVRDAYLHLPLHDIDLAVPGDGRPLARHIANTLGGAYYALDRERGVGRALIPWDDAQVTVDVARFRGPDLVTDLQKRDFTLNAMAVRLSGDLQAVIDPLGGLLDLEARRLRQCSPEAIVDDPVRALRAVRASVAYNLRIDPPTLRSLKTCAPRLGAVSGERIRDEFFQILGSKRPSAALATLHRLGLLAPVVPEVSTMQGVQQSPPHRSDLWQHTLNTVEWLDTILRIIAPQRGDNLTANVQAGMIAVALDKVRGQLQQHMDWQWPNGRSHRALLMLAALLHDAGKPAARSVDAEGDVHFVQHEQIGATLAVDRAAALRLSSDETARLAVIVRHHMRPHWLSGRAALTSRAIYRFWRATGPAGVDICLLALADYLATYGALLDVQAWIHYVETVQTLLERYYLSRDTAVTPPALINGQQLLDHFHLEPSRLIGELLEQIREAQVEGEISTPEEALEWVQHFLNGLRGGS